MRRPLNVLASAFTPRVAATIINSIFLKSFAKIALLSQSHECKTEIFSLLSKISQ